MFEPNLNAPPENMDEDVVVAGVDVDPNMLADVVTVVVLKMFVGAVVVVADVNDGVSVKEDEDVVWK